MNLRGAWLKSIHNYTIIFSHFQKIQRVFITKLIYNSKTKRLIHIKHRTNKE